MCHLNSGLGTSEFTFCALFTFVQWTSQPFSISLMPSNMPCTQPTNNTPLPPPSTHLFLPKIASASCPPTCPANSPNKQHPHFPTINSLVLAQHEHPQRLERGKAGNLLNLVVIQVEKDESPERGQVLYACDGVVLVVQQSQLVLTLQDGAHSQLPPEHHHHTFVTHPQVLKDQTCCWKMENVWSLQWILHF